MAGRIDLCRIDKHPPVPLGVNDEQALLLIPTELLGKKHDRTTRHRRLRHAEG
ncbi:hypothetical protein Aple_025110 [Acrocarpospora pleiomorpha]|uniref:Uncharacterized protein n=1 Tax=Acrocarpospora pleiomorpha TaxID=90975 RepID=A0A5M3XDA4_9ACTN|nr:hypothetical protein Aple_025110 [Acrocarpospora pleiomorpha]